MAMRRLLDAFVADERGATAIEYAIIAAGVAGLTITMFLTIGTTVRTVLWDKIGAIFP